MPLAYARVSGWSQHPEAQADALTAAATVAVRHGRFGRTGLCDARAYGGLVSRLLLTLSLAAT